MEGKSSNLALALKWTVSLFLVRLNISLSLERNLGTTLLPYVEKLYVSSHDTLAGGSSLFYHSLYVRTLRLNVSLRSILSVFKRPFRCLIKEL